MKMVRKMLAVLLVVAMVAALFLTAYPKEIPVVSSEAEGVFMAAYNSTAPNSCRTFLSLNEFCRLYGEEKGGQCANCMNYYFDTGDALAIDAVWKLVKDWPVGAEVFWLNEYTPASSSAPSTKVDVTEAPFPDVPTDAWYAEAVAAMKDSGIINGCDDGLFHPEREVKTGEFYAMLVRAGTRDGVDVTKADGVSNDTHWAKGVMANARSCYLWPIEDAGHEDDVVLRGEAISRVEMLRGYALRHGVASYKTAWEWTMTRERTEGNMTFEDIPDHAAIEEYLRTAHYGADKNQFVRACNLGVVKGVDAVGNLNPFGTLTRAEVAQMFYNALLTQRVGCCHLGGSAG